MDKKAFLEKLHISADLEELRGLADYIKEHFLEQASVQQARGQAKQEKAEAEAMLVVSGTVTGKNESQREAALVLALAKDEAWQQADRTERDCDNRLAVLDAEIEAASRQSRAVALGIEAKTAILRYLAGEVGRE